MGVYFSSRAGGLSKSLQQAYENWARQMSTGSYPSDTVWDTEANATIYNRLIPEGIALFESRMLRICNPIPQSTPSK
jgi:hypothetical protein